MKVDPRLIGDIMLFIGASISTYYMLSYAMKMMADDNGSGNKSELRKKASLILQKLQMKKPDLEITLDKYEQIILGSVILPEEIKVTFNGKLIYYRKKNGNAIIYSNSWYYSCYFLNIYFRYWWVR